MKTKFARRCRKQWFYLTNTLAQMVPDAWYRRQLSNYLQRISDDADAQARIAYYMKLQEPFALPATTERIADLRANGQIMYYYDMCKMARHFPSAARIAYVYGDVTEIPEYPALVKSRPIDGDNANSVLVRMETMRHFYFVNDRIPFRDKKDVVVWRGKSFSKPHRINFVNQFIDKPGCDIGLIDSKLEGSPGYRPFMSIVDQLRHKFIISIEGNDVATNLKWIMSSNSLCFAAKPKYETWYMEGRLIANHHFVQVANDYSDIEEKMAYYLAHPDEAEAIISNAHRWVAQFRDPAREHAMALQVFARYLQLAQA
ncbi:MAG: lipopolysaccharide A protein [Planctomycetota bacterium]|nr:MAG: lipopolysaccharide A protein [Planctomycetota bacterium]